MIFVPSDTLIDVQILCMLHSQGGNLTGTAEATCPLHLPATGTGTGLPVHGTAVQQSRRL